MAEQIFYGYHEDAAPGRKPDYEPMTVEPFPPCPFCGARIDDPHDVRTHSLMYTSPSYAKRSYFYRTHRTCAEKHGSPSMDGFILDMIRRNGD